MINVTEAVAGYDWNLDRVRHLLREVSSAMGAELIIFKPCSDRLTSASDRSATSQAMAPGLGSCGSWVW